MTFYIGSAPSPQPVRQNAGGAAIAIVDLLLTAAGFSTAFSLDGTTLAMYSKTRRCVRPA